MISVFRYMLLAIGALCFLVALYLTWERINPNRLSFHTQTLSSQNAHSPITPTNIIIPSLQKGLPIIPSKLSQGTWQTTTDGVSYLTNSPLPGEKGNSILYGHNWTNLLGNLKRIKPGAEIKIRYNNQSIKTFIVEYTMEVTPDQTHVLSQTKDTRITLYTCSGFLDTKRFVVTAFLKEG